MLMGAASARSGASIQAIWLYETLSNVDTPLRQGRRVVCNAQTFEIPRRIKVAKHIFSLAVLALLSACGVMSVSTDELRPGSADGVTFLTKGRVTSDQVWTAAMSAMGNGMAVVESHKPSGAIVSRVGAAPLGKVVAFFITPSSPQTAEYSVELVSNKPQGSGPPEHRNLNIAIGSLQLCGISKLHRGFGGMNW